MVIGAGHETRRQTEMGPVDVAVSQAHEGKAKGKQAAQSEPVGYPSFVMLKGELSLRWWVVKRPWSALGVCFRWHLSHCV